MFEAAQRLLVPFLRHGYGLSCHLPGGRTDIVVYVRRENGVISCAADDCWISALWDSVEALLSWVDDWDAAEAEYERINPPTGVRDKLLGRREATTAATPQT